MADKSNHQVLRGMPFQPPQELAMRAARLKRWTMVLGGCAGLTLVLLVAAVVVLLNMGNQSSAASAANPKPFREALLKDFKQPADDATRSLSAAKNLKQPADSSKKLTPDERFLKALGGLTAAHLYQSYLNIGLLADGVESEAYTEEQAQNMLAAVIGLLAMVDAQLDDVAGNNIAADDLEALERIRSLSVLLRTQGNALRSYWQTGDRVHAERYHQVRERAWTSLSEVLGLQ